MLNLVGREQNAFLAGRSRFDNIIAVQELVHTLETDTKKPLMMLIKLDIEAYDMVEWNVVLTTLHLMNFPIVWIDWVRANL